MRILEAIGGFLLVLGAAYCVLADTFARRCVANDKTKKNVRRSPII